MQTYTVVKASCDVGEMNRNLPEMMNYHPPAVLEISHECYSWTKSFPEDSVSLFCEQRFRDPSAKKLMTKEI